MIKHYIIDGTNLVFKMPKLKKLDLQASREKLAIMLDRHFMGKNIKVSLHFDGHPGEAIRTSKIKVKYSENEIADTRIKKEIDHLKNPKVAALVSSDHNLMEFAKVSSCMVIRSEDFAKTITAVQTDAEDELIKSIDNEEIKKLFGVKDNDEEK